MGLAAVEFERPAFSLPELSFPEKHMMGSDFGKQRDRSGVRQTRKSPSVAFDSRWRGFEVRGTQWKMDSAV